MGALIYYLGRAGQVIGMWILLVDVVTAGPMGPNAKLFGVGVVAYSPLARGVLTGKYESMAEPPTGSRAARSDVPGKGD